MIKTGQQAAIKYINNISNINNKNNNNNNFHLNNAIDILFDYVIWLRPRFKHKDNKESEEPFIDDNRNRRKFESVKRWKWTRKVIDLQKKGTFDGYLSKCRMYILRRLTHFTFT